ncbi:MAG: DUF3352 domain-containing protein [Chloroflexota bacterium]
MSSIPSARPRPIRWVVALLVTVAMLVGTTGVAVFAQNGSTGGPAFAPASSVAWAELRLDLPGDQEEQLGQLLGHLPGFADPAALDAKVNELLDQVVSQASSGAATWTGNVDPWSNRQFGLALLEIPASTTVVDDNDDNDDNDDDDSVNQDDPAMVIGLGVKDRTALEAQLSTLLTQDDISTESYAGATVTTVDDDASYAVTDDYLLVAPHAADVKAALDVLAGTAPGLAQDAGYAAAAQRIPANRLGAVYFALSTLRPFLEAQLTGQPGAEAALDMLDQLPAWVSGYAQASSDHLTLAFDMQTPASLPVPSMRATDLAAHFPADTLVYLETRDLGRTAHAVLEAVMAQVPEEDAQQLAQIEQLLGSPLEEFLDPVEDAALGIGATGGQPQVGLAATLSDPATAQTRATSLLALVRLAGARSGLTATESEVAGTTVTTIALPSDTTAFGSPVTISVAVADDRLYLGLGDFVADALTQDASASLASTPRFQIALAEGGSPNAGLVFVDLAGAQSLFESMGGADEDYQTNVKPWLDTLDYLVVSSAADQDTLSTKALLYVR